MMEVAERFNHEAVKTICTYSMLKLGSSRVSIGLRNLSCKSVTIKSKTVVATVVVANFVPMPINDLRLEPLSPERERLFEKIDLSRITDWDQEDQKQVREWFKEYGQLFALDDLDLGHTSVVKHEIKLNYYTPFKERYRHIPPHQYEEVKKHLKEMLEIGTIRKSNSPWASTVVLVRKKDGS